MPALIITSTIRPDPAVPTLVVRDPRARLAEYEAAFRFYATLVPRTFESIVYVDNSGADLAPIERLGHELRVPLEVLAAPPTSPKLGRGEGEARIVDHAVTESRSVLRSDDRAWKVTGRYVVRNLDKIVARSRRADLSMNLRRYPTAWADIYVYGFNKHGYERVLSRAARESLGMAGAEPPSREVLMATTLLPLVDTNLLDIDPRLGVEPRIEGVRGFDGRAYHGGRQRLKWLLRASSRRVAPGIWL